MTKDLSFIRINNKWYIDLPNWRGRYEALLMVGGAHNILDELGNMIQKDYITLVVSTDDPSISGMKLERQNYTILGGANYIDCKNNIVWLCPVTLFVFGKYPKYIYYTLKINKN